MLQAVSRGCGRSWSDREETPKEWDDYRFGSDVLPTPKGCHLFGANHAILSGFGYGLAKNLESSHPFGISSPNPPQMRILERVLVFQAVAEDAVKTGVSEEDCPCEHQPGDGERRAKDVKGESKPTMVDQVIRPGTEAGVCQIADHAEIGHKEPEGEESPSVIQSRKKKKGESEQKEFFEFEQVFHVVSCGASWQLALLLITPDFLWITLLELCIKTVQASGERGEFLPQRGG